VPFNVKFEIDPEKRTTGEREGDPRIELKLLAELPGILNWALEGYREWADQGLRPPLAVRAATESYRQESDILAHFIEEELVKLRADQAGNTGGEIYNAYKLWCQENGEKQIDNRQFAAALQERGFTKKKDRTGRVRYFGLALSVRTVEEVVTE
jgi:putative DNA primase/helicase